RRVDPASAAATSLLPVRLLLLRLEIRGRELRRELASLVEHGARVTVDHPSGLRAHASDVRDRGVVLRALVLGPEGPGLRVSTAAKVMARPFREVDYVGR